MDAKGQNIHEVVKNLTQAYLRDGTWSAVGRKFGITAGTAHRIVMRGYEPKSAHIRAKLGLPVFLLAPACPVCGSVHTTKRCTKRRIKSHVTLLDIPVSDLRWMLEHREDVINGN